VEHFIQTLDDPSPDVKILILEALGDLREPRLSEILTPKLQQSSGPTREALITTLGRQGDIRAIEVLLPFLMDGAPTIRQRVAEALGHLGVRAAEAGERKGISPST
jgi:HEAT repeat protein